MDELPEAAGVVVVNSLGIPKRFHDRTGDGDTVRLSEKEALTGYFEYILL